MFILPDWTLSHAPIKNIHQPKGGMPVKNSWMKTEKATETEVILFGELDVAYMNWLSFYISFWKEKSELKPQDPTQSKDSEDAFLPFAKDVWAEDEKTYSWIKFWLSSQNWLMKWKQWKSDQPIIKPLSHAKGNRAGSDTEPKLQEHTLFLIR